MRQSKKTILLVILITILSSCVFGANIITNATANFPFPVNKAYPYGIYSTSFSTSNILNLYNTWKVHYYTTTGAGGYGRVQRPDQANDTVSEGIGYGLLLAVYFGDATTYDNLWSYEQIHLDADDLMIWNLDSTGADKGGANDSATDADEDIAFSLLMAARQFGNGTPGTDDATLLSTAQTQTGYVMTHDIDPAGAVNPGDTWNTWYYPSYWDPAYYYIWNNLGWNSKWATVLSTMTTWAGAGCRNASNGLIGDSCGPAGAVYNGDPCSGGGNGSCNGLDYLYNSCRVPFRFELYYSWFGTDAASECSDIAGFFNNIAPTAVKDGYVVSSGAVTGSNNNACFVGPAGCSLMRVAGDQTNLNSYCSTEGGFGANSYYNDSWQILSLLLMTGNYWDLRNIIGGTPTFTPTITQTPSAALLDTFEEDGNSSGVWNGGATNNWGGAWYSYHGTTQCANDTTKVWPVAGATFVMTSPGWSGSPYGANWCARVTGYVYTTYCVSSCNQASCSGTINYPCIGMGTNVDASTATTRNVSGFSGFVVAIKGDGTHTYSIRFMTPATVTNTGFNDYKYSFVPPSTWTQLQLPFSDFTQETGWGIPVSQALVLQNLIQVNFQTYDYGHNVDLSIDDVGFYPNLGWTPTPTKTQTITPTYTMPPALPTMTITPTPTSPPNTSTSTTTPSPTYTITKTNTGTSTPTDTVTLTNTPPPTSTSTATPTSTGTRTNTGTNTPTFTPTFTFTVTLTNTPLPSATPTDTGTNTPLPTGTSTATPTFTGTRTNTLTNTPTNTPTNTGTNTPLSTSTSTATGTNTPLPTGSNTVSPTATGTSTNTLTITSTNTPTNTSTNTPTQTSTGTKTSTITTTLTSTATPTYTITLTNTGTNSPTFTGTPTFTNTPTFTVTVTSTHTVTPTSTDSPIVSATPTFTNIINTWTQTPSYTISPTITLTATSTSTPTWTQTSTPTNTPTYTPTWTPTGTRTNTTTNTPTFTPTSTGTTTNTPVNTSTNTPANTFTNTGTSTPTVTKTNTPTFTLTETPTFTITQTGTSTVTMTITNTLNVSATPTYTPTLFTLTITPTFTISPTATLTGTRTFTATDTPVNTSTFTPVNTSTDTPVNTATYTSTTPPAFTATDTPTTPALPTATYTSTTVPSLCQVDTMASCSSQDAWGGYWYSFNDVCSGLTSVVWPPAATTCGGAAPAPFTMSSPGYGGSGDCAMEMTGTVASGGQIGVGMQLNANAGGPTYQTTNLSGAVGIRFYTQGDGKTYEVKIPYTDGSGNNLDGYNDYSYTFTAPAGVWTQITVPFTSLTQQAGWGTVVALANVLANAKEVQFQTVGSPSASVMLWIDNFEIYGCGSTPTYTSTVGPTPTNTPVPICQTDIMSCTSGSGGGNQNVWGGYWYTYNDLCNAGTSIVWPPAATTCGGSSPAFTMNQPGYGGAGDCAANMTGVVTTAYAYGFIGIGTGLSVNSPATTINLSGAVGISFYTKGDGKTYSVKIPYQNSTGGSLDGSNDYAYSFTAPAAWSLVTIPFTSFAQATGWGTTVALSTVLQNASAIQWQTTTQPLTSVNLWIDNLSIYGCPGAPTATNTTVVPNTPTNTPPNTATPTYTGTPTSTVTSTLTNTVTPTYTITMTVPAGSTMTITPTITPTIAINLEINSITISPASVADNQDITVVMQVENIGTNTADNVAPSAPVLTVSGGASATQISGPSPASTTLGGSGATTAFTWVYEVTSATGSITISDTVSGKDAVDGASMTSTSASSNMFTCATPTFTSTGTPANTAINTPTITPTSTGTPANTATNTPTITPTSTGTPANTATNTPVATGTATNTPVPVPSGVPTIIGPPKPYPNPFNPNANSQLWIQTNVTAGGVVIPPSGIDSITVKIYTAAYRLVLKQEFQGEEIQTSLDGQGVKVGYNSQYLMNLSEGTYYYVVTAVSGGVSVRSKVDKIIILK